MRQAPSALMMFAAGFGTRMGALTADVPKPLLQVAGQTLLDRALALVDAAGITRTVVNLHYHGQQIADHLAHRPDIALSWEQGAILETGGGLRAALPQLGPGPVFTLNPDAVWAGPNPLTWLQSAWEADRMDALLLLVPAAAAKGRTGRADFALAPGGQITRAGTTGQHLYTGAQIIRTDGLASIAQASFSLNLLWDQIIQNDRAFGVVYPGDWCDVGTPAGLDEATRLLVAHNV